MFVLAVPAGCADYLNRYDSVTLAAGDANQINRMIQTENPFNEASYDTDISADGARTVKVIRRYQNAEPKQGPVGPATAVAVAEAK